MPWLWLNGELLPDDQPAIHARDRGFTLGDGLFETIQARAGRTPVLPLHLERLRRSATSLRLDVPYADGELETAIHALLTANRLADALAVVRLTVTRGVSAERGLALPAHSQPATLFTADAFHGYPPALYERGLRLSTSAIRRSSTSPAARLKTLSYVDNVLAREEAARAGADDALLLNERGDIAGLSAANLFMASADGWLTPSLDSGTLPGTTRRLVLERLAAGHVRETAVQPEQLAGAEEVLATNALLGIMPVTSLDGQPIGNGAPGPRTRALAAAWEAWWSRA